MLKTVTFETLPRRRRVRNDLIAKKEAINNEQLPIEPPINLPRACCEQEEVFIGGGNGTDQDGDVHGIIDPLGDYISQNNLGSGNPVYALATRINASTYDLPSKAKYIISVAIDTIPTTHYTFTSPITVTFPATLHADSRVYVRYIA